MLSISTMLFKLCVLAAFAASIVAVPAPGSYVLHEKRDAPLKNWVKRSVINRKTKLPMRIGMKQSNLDIGDGLLMDVYVHWFSLRLMALIPPAPAMIRPTSVNTIRLNKSLTCSPLLRSPSTLSVNGWRCQASRATGSLNQRTSNGCNSMPIQRRPRSF